MKFRSALWIPQLRGSMSASDSVTRSQFLLNRAGFFNQTASGIFTALPLGLRVLEKIERIVDDALQSDPVQAQKVRLPFVLSADSWRQTGRWASTGDELFRLRDRRGADYCLAPTHEETVTDLVADYGITSHKSLPIKLYQITSKFRDELRPRFGLLRGREFTMKDLYSFHANESCATQFYGTVLDAYDRILSQLGVDFVRVKADTGNMGGKFSHEIHILAPVGEDDIVSCSLGDFATNVELLDADDGKLEGACTEPGCSCGGRGELKTAKGIEVCHGFILGTRYSEPLKAFGVGPDQSRFPLVMGCYGLGISRLLAAVVESNSKTDDAIVWPHSIAPYNMVVMTGSGSRDSQARYQKMLLEEVLPNLMSYTPSDEIVVDDRWVETYSKKKYEARLVGYPWILTVGEKGIEVENAHTGDVSITGDPTLLRSLLVTPTV